MSMFEEKLNQDYKNALKGKDVIKTSVIRMLKADMINTAIKLKKKSLSDDDILKIIQNHIKRHEDSIEQFKKGNRDDLVQKEQKELAILKSYAPEQLTDEDLEKIAKETILECNASTPKDTGIVTKKILEKTKGRADGKRVSMVVLKLLSR